MLISRTLIVALAGALFMRTDGAPSVHNFNDAKLLRDERAIRSFSFFDMPVIRRNAAAETNFAMQPTEIGDADEFGGFDADGGYRYENYQLPARIYKKMSPPSSVETSENSAAYASPPPSSAQRQQSKTTTRNAAAAAAAPAGGDMFVLRSPSSQTKDVAPAAAVEQPIGVVPAFTGGFRSSGSDAAAPKWPTGAAMASANGGEAAITNPAAYFLDGADLSKVPPPKCRMLNCVGPMPNDDDFSLVQQSAAAANDASGNNAQTCHQTFVPLNGCFNQKGYPIGMLCTICCDCSAELHAQMSKSRGIRDGYRADL